MRSSPAGPEHHHMVLQQGRPLHWRTPTLCDPVACKAFQPGIFRTWLRQWEPFMTAIQAENLRQGLVEISSPTRVASCQKVSGQKPLAGLGSVAGEMHPRGQDTVGHLAGKSGEPGSLQSPSRGSTWARGHTWMSDLQARLQWRASSFRAGQSPLTFSARAQGTLTAVFSPCCMAAVRLGGGTAPG